MKENRLIKMRAIALPLSLLLVGSLSFAGGLSTAKFAKLLVGDTATAVKSVMIMSPQKYSEHIMTSLREYSTLKVVRGAQGEHISDLIKAESKFPTEDGYATIHRYSFTAKNNETIVKSVQDFAKEFDGKELSFFEDLIPKEVLARVGSNPRILIELQDESTGFAQMMVPRVQITGDNVGGTSLMGVPPYTLSNEASVRAVLRVLQRDGIVAGKEVVDTGAKGL